MKLRIRGNSLRLRLTQTEVMQLAKAGKLEDRIQMGPQAEEVLIYRIELTADGKSPTAGFTNNQIVVVLPETQARRWAESGEVGIYGEKTWGLKLIVEKDFKCLEPRPIEDDSDAFENPGKHDGSACGPGDG